MGPPELHAGSVSPNPHHVIEDFIGDIEAVIALKDNGGGRMALEQMVEKPVRLIGDRIGMGIGE
jgi:hypothetical protein